MQCFLPARRRNTWNPQATNNARETGSNFKAWQRKPSSFPPAWILRRKEDFFGFLPASTVTPQPQVSEFPMKAKLLLLLIIYNDPGWPSPQAWLINSEMSLLLLGLWVSVKGTRRKKKKGRALAGTHPKPYLYVKIISSGRENGTVHFPGHSAAAECCAMHTLGLFAPIRRVRLCHTLFTVSLHTWEASIAEKAQARPSLAMNSHRKQHTQLLMCALPEWKLQLRAESFLGAPGETNDFSFHVWEQADQITGVLKISQVFHHLQMQTQCVQA